MFRTIFAAAALCLLSAAAHADTTYYYTGQYYSSASGPYTTQERVTGSIALPTPLAANLTAYDATNFMTFFSFNDGVFTFDQHDTLGGATFTFWTDSTGQISSYRIYASSGNGNRIDLQNGTDGATILYPSYSHASTSGPGTFSLQNPASVTPEPSSFALLGTGLLGVAGVVRRRVRAPEPFSR